MRADSIANSVAILTVLCIYLAVITQTICHQASKTSRIQQLKSISCKVRRGNLELEVTLVSFPDPNNPSADHFQCLVWGSMVRGFDWG